MIAAVIAAFPDGPHPVAARAFMTTARPDLSAHGTALSPRHGSAAVGTPAATVALAVTLGEQV